MRSPGDRLVALSFELIAHDERRNREPLSPAQLVGRLGVLMLITLCFGLAARLLA
jgi:hypothetical protein